MQQAVIFVLRTDLKNADKINVTEKIRVQITQPERQLYEDPAQGTIPGYSSGHGTGGTWQRCLRPAPG